MENKEHSELQKELNVINTQIQFYIKNCKILKKIVGYFFNKVLENPTSEYHRKHKQKAICNLLHNRKKLLNFQQQAITIKQQIKQTQRANNKAFIEYNNNKQKERLKAMNIDIQDNNNSKVITLKQIIDNKQ